MKGTHLMTADIRLIAADFDGTLLNREGGISDYNKEMIKKSQDAGIIFAAATGATRKTRRKSW